MPDETSILILGAGLAGVTAARSLVAAGHEVAIVERNATVGGRLATRRIGDATLDHGAQFFTVRGDALAALVDEATAAGLVHEWCRGFDHPPDGYPRYASAAGMQGFAAWLADGLVCRTGVTVTAVAVDGDRWRIEYAGGEMSARAVIATPPVPETLGVLRAGGVRLPPPVADRLAGIDYHRTLAVTALLDAPPAVPPPGGVQLQEGPFGFVADNVAKGVSAAPALTLHASHAVSAARWDDDPASVVADLLAEARTWIGDATVLQAELDHWRYAGPIATDPDPEVSAIIDGLPIVFAGDAFAGPKFEGAFNSGRAAAEAVARLL